MELNVYVGPELEKTLFERMRTGYKRARNLHEYLETALMTPWFVQALQEEEAKLNGGRIEVRDIRINIHGGITKDAESEQVVAMEITKWNGGGEPSFYYESHLSTHGPISAAVKILRKVSGINFDVMHYEERIAVDESGVEKGAASLTVATFLIRDDQNRIRRGFGMSRDSDESKIAAIVQALNRLPWNTDEKGKSVPPQ
jgi:hypothetical protein